MPRFRGWRKSKLEQIGPALLPAAALTAVPVFSPGPQAPQGRPISLALNVFDTLVPPPSPDAALGEPSSENGGASADPHSGYFEGDDEMEEAGYTTVAQATQPNRNRKSYSDRERVPTPPTIRNVATAGLVTQSGDVYHILEPEEGDPIESDIYALPVKGKGPPNKTLETQDEEISSMERTQQDVRRAMQVIHDMPAEETMMRLSESRQVNGSHLGSSSGRGTMWKDDIDEDSDEEPPPLPPPPIDNDLTPEVEASPEHTSEAEATPEEVSEAKVTVKHVIEVKAAPEHQTEVKELVCEPLKQEVHSPRSAGSGSGTQVSQLSATPRDAPSLPLEPEIIKEVKTENQNLPQEVIPQKQMAAPVRSGGGSGSSRRSTTPQDAPSMSLQREVERVKEENQNLHQKVTSLRKVAASVGSGGSEGGGSSRRSHVVEELKSENEVLKNAVGRLNQELSHYQAAFRPLSQDDLSKLQGLPQKGPVPAWLINKRYLAPLFLAYDDLIQEKEEVIRKCQAQLQTLKNRTEEVVRENQRYQLKGNSGGIADVGAICASDWQALRDQARLVLEENQILTEQVDIQHMKVKDLCSSHMHEVSRLTKKLTSCEQEREEIERELEETRSKLKDIKQKHDKMQLEAVKRTTMHDHINSVAGLQRSVIEEQEHFEKEKEEMINKLMASDEERKRQTLAAIEAGAENKRLKAELSAVQHAVRKSQSKLLLLQKAIRQSESKELVTQNELANVIKIVEKTALERDTAFRVAKQKQRDCKDTVHQILDSGVVMSKMEEKLKMYKLRASARLQTVSEKLKGQEDLFNRQRQEYEREICYLRSLLKEKEERIEQMKEEKRSAEESLETVWQAARLENQHLKESLVDSVHKLRQHPTLHAALDEEEDLEKLLHFSA